MYKRENDSDWMRRIWGVGGELKWVVKMTQKEASPLSRAPYLERTTKCFILTYPYCKSSCVA